MKGLSGLPRWVTLPSAASGFVGAVAGILYAFLTIDFLPGTVIPLVICVGIFVTLAAVRKDRQEQRALPALKAVANGSSVATKENLAEAVRELAQIGDLSFWVNLGYWCAGSAGTGLIYAQVFSAQWQVAARVAFIGIGVGPLVSTLVYLAIVVRSRTAIKQVADAGLDPREVVAAIAPQRMQLQRRLVIYAAVAVGTPMMIVADLVVLHTERTFSRVLAQAEPIAQAAILSAELDAGLLTQVLVGTTVSLVVVVCGYIAGSALGTPIRALAKKTAAMAGGKLGGSALVAAEDEIWAAVVGFTTLETQLMRVIVQLQEAGQKIQETTDELVSSRSTHEQGSAEQTAALVHTSGTTLELARSAKQIALNATHVAGLASQTLDAARMGKNNADQFYASILKVREGNQAIADSVVKLNKRVQQVGRIVEFIDGIADKSDLLALNAELEGNKAGEVGRGFSLVAAEMRRLSESVMVSTKEIIGLIEDVRDATNAAVMATEAGVKASDAGSALARKVSEGLSDILSYANTTADAVQRITLSTYHQQVGTDQLAHAMNEILLSTKAGEGASEQMSKTNSELQALATELKIAVGRFEVS